MKKKPYNLLGSMDLKHMARLARLYFKDEELKFFESQIGGILKFVEKLNEVDVKDAEPTSHPLSLKNVFRGDEVTPSMPVQEFLKHAPAVHGSFFEVPKIIEDKS